MTSKEHFTLKFSPRRKKLSKFSQKPNWKNASNYVAKRYMKPVDLDTYFEDVKLQMDSKLWGDRYSRLSVPKKVCVSTKKFNFVILIWDSGAQFLVMGFIRLVSCSSLLSSKPWFKVFPWLGLGLGLSNDAGFVLGRFLPDLHHRV